MYMYSTSVFAITIHHVGDVEDDDATAREMYSSRKASRAAFSYVLRNWGGRQDAAGIALSILGIFGRCRLHISHMQTMALVRHMFVGLGKAAVRQRKMRSREGLGDGCDWCNSLDYRKEKSRPPSTPTSC